MGKKSDKPLSPQSDVKIVGGKTTVNIRALGETTLARMAALLGELSTNATTAPEIHKAAVKTRDALLELNLALGFAGIPKPAVVDGQKTVVDTQAKGAA